MFIPAALAPPLPMMSPSAFSSDSQAVVQRYNNRHCQRHRHYHHHHQHPHMILLLVLVLLVLLFLLLLQLLLWRGVAQSSQRLGRIAGCLTVPSYCRERAGRDLDLSASCVYRLH